MLLTRRLLLGFTTTLLLCIGASFAASAGETKSVQRLLARADIEDALNRYTWGLDRGEADLFASAFTDDGVLWFKDREMKGRAEIKKFITNAGPQPPREHIRANSLIEFVSDKEARVKSYYVTIDGDTTTGYVTHLIGSYDDLFVKRGEQWLIKERKPAVFGPEPKN